ncbi:MAG: AMIN domain-containing protein [candidate division NC10 bacterium]|nr:AMIN domain-containing protein [candidate division NC10 bacterium]
MRAIKADNSARKRRIIWAVLFFFCTSCATAGAPTDHALKLSSVGPSLQAGAARVVDVTGVQVLAEGPGEVSIVVTADGALVDYASFAVHDPPSLVIDLPNARNAISRPIDLPPGSPIARVETMQLQQSPNPVLRLTFDLNRLLPYRVELTRNGLQILVSAEASEQAPVAQGPAKPEQTVEPEAAQSAGAAQPKPSPPATTAAPGPTAPAPVAKPAIGAVESPAVSRIEPEKTPTREPQSAQKPLAPPVAKRPSAEKSVSRAEPVAPPSADQPKAAVANKRLSLDFKGADLDDLLRLISEVSGLNIVAAHGLKDRKERDVTVRLTNVEWRQALDVILRAKGLSYEQDGNLLYVGSKAEIQKRKEERVKEIETAALKSVKIEEAKRKVEDERRKVEEEERRYAKEPPCTRVIHLAHTKAVDVKRHLERIKTRRGTIELEGDKTLIVNDVESVCLKMVAVVSELDAPPKEPFVTKLFLFNYAKAADLKTQLTTLKTPQGSIVVDERSSRVIVKDLPAAVARIEAFLKEIDIPTRQVLIEARIVEATRQFSQSLGIQWGGTGIPTQPGARLGVTTFGGNPAGGSSSGGSSGGSSSGGTPFPIQFPGTTQTSGIPFSTTTGGGVPFFGPIPLALNLPAISSGASPFLLGATIGSLANRFLVGVQLSAAEHEGKIRTLSSPRVATQDNEEAEIKQGTQVPFTTIDSSGRTVVSFQDAFIKLKVKPHITPDSRVAMKVEAERSFAGDRIDFSGGFAFPINTRKATTNILVQNGSTIVIGGLLQSTESTAIDEVPSLGHIPIFGWLFKRRSLGPDERVELLIFLTPSVLQESRL